MPPYFLVVEESARVQEVIEAVRSTAHTTERVPYVYVVKEIVLLAGEVGGTMPFITRRLGGDPAMMTGPVLTTITDITGVTIYLGLATLFLSGLMIGA